MFLQVELDLLYHTHLFAAFRGRLAALAAGAPAQAGLDLLDLGCGDASQAARVLLHLGSTLQLGSYTGVDVSEAALALAAPTLAFLQPPCRVALQLADMKE